MGVNPKSFAFNILDGPGLFPAITIDFAEILLETLPPFCTIISFKFVLSIFSKTPVTIKVFPNNLFPRFSDFICKKFRPSRCII